MRELCASLLVVLEIASAGVKFTISLASRCCMDSGIKAGSSRLPGLLKCYICRCVFCDSSLLSFFPRPSQSCAARLLGYAVPSRLSLSTGYQDARQIRLGGPCGYAPFLIYLDFMRTLLKVLLAAIGASAAVLPYRVERVAVKPRAVDGVRAQRLLSCARRPDLEPSAEAQGRLRPRSSRLDRKLLLGQLLHHHHPCLASAADFEAPSPQLELGRKAVLLCRQALVLGQAAFVLCQADLIRQAALFVG